MNYSIKPVINAYANSAGLQKVAIRVIYNRKIYYAETEIKVKKDQFDGTIKKHPHALVMNGIIRQRITDIETRLLAFSALSLFNSLINCSVLFSILIALAINIFKIITEKFGNTDFSVLYLCHNIIT